MATDDPISVLVAQVHSFSRAVCDAELRRLARRAAFSRPDDLKVIDAAMAELVERLFLARLRSLPQHAVQLRLLFDTAREDS